VGPCAANPTSCVATALGNGTAAGADAGLLGQLPPNALSGMPNATDLVNHAATSGAGGALASMLPSSMGSAGEALAAVAQDAQDQGGKLAGSLGMAPPVSTYSGGGGPRGGGGGGGGASGDNATLASLFGNSGGAAGPTIGRDPTSVTTFGSATPSTDIWHSNTHQTIFDIISSKVLHVTHRVQ
jgi:hypothetical protein